MTDFGRDARDMPASDIGATSFNELAAGRHEGRREFLDWHYATSPFCASLVEDRGFRADFAHKSFGTAAPSEWEEAGQSSPYSGFLPATALRADNDNARIWLVK